MDIQTFIGQIAHIDGLLERHRLGSALESLRQIVSTDSPLQLEYAAIKETYRYMSLYSLDGAPDPRRADIFGELTERVRTLARTALRLFRLNDGDNSLYFSTLRYETAASDSASSLIERILSANRQLDMAILTDEANDIPRDKATGRPLRPLLEESETRLFNRIWVEYPLSAQTLSQLKSFFTNPAVRTYQKEHLVSALFLGELDWHDENRLTLLADIYADTSGARAVRLKALTALIVSLHTHAGRHITSRLDGKLRLLGDTPEWQREVKEVWMELVKARDTERVTRKIKDELLPEIMKLRPDIEKRLGKIQGDAMSMEENPEWQEILDNSGLSDKLKELSEIQEDGGDIMMGTFGHLKSFPFFRDVANWFLPFHTEHSSVASGAEHTFFQALESSAALCDNDKYSLACAFAMMPASQRDMFRSQLAGHEAQMAEALAGDITAPRESAIEIARYVRNLYRFFKLFRRKSEFQDIFLSPVNLASLPLLEPALNDPSTIELIAEFYFKRGYWAEALELFTRLDSMEAPSPIRYQKMGYCCQQNGNHEEALKYYRKSELLKSDSLWTLQRIAVCQRTLMRFDEALETYLRIELQKPQDASVALMKGHCLLSLKRYDEALQAYYKTDFLEPERKRALRPIAWTLLLTGDYDRSRTYYNRILCDKPNENDFLNNGHLEMLSGNFRAAVSSYAKAREMSGESSSNFDDAFSADIHILQERGIDPIMIGIVRDNVDYPADNQISLS